MNTKALLAAIVIAASAQAACAQFFGSGIVFDPTQSGHAIQQITQGNQLYTTTVTTTRNVIAAYNLAQRMIVLTALTTGMRASEVFGLRWPDVMYGEGLLAVRAKLKGGKMRYVPLLPEVAGELKRYPVVISDDRVFPPRKGAYGNRRRLEGSFEDLLRRAKISNFRFHDLRHTFASWYMMNGGDLYELAKILGHSNIKMTERYAKLGRKHIARTSNTAREIWKLMEREEADRANVV